MWCTEVTIISKKIDFLNHLGTISYPKCPYTLNEYANRAKKIRATGCMETRNTTNGTTIASNIPSIKLKEYDASGLGLTDLW